MTATDPVELSLPAISPRPHWAKPLKKTIYTLNVSASDTSTEGGAESFSKDFVPKYEPEICKLTYPLMAHYAHKIGADFKIISRRKYPDWPVTYEKLQINELAKADGNDWSIFIDSDALISPEFFDVTDHLAKDTVCHNGRDMAGIRWRYDQYFRRDGRNWGSCNWFTIGSDWCLDLWRPLDDLTPQQAVENIFITINERASGTCQTDHLIDDYTLSRNIARFGLKATTVTDVCAGLGWRGPDGRGFNNYLYHLYAITKGEKLRRMLAVLSAPLGALIQDPRNPQGQPWGIGWGLMDAADAKKLSDEWKLNSLP